MPRPIHWTDEMDDIIREGAETGELLDVIAEELGICSRSIQKRAVKLGIRFHRGCRVDVPRRLRIIDLIRSGWNTAKSIALYMGFSRSGIDKAVREMVSDGILRRDGHGRYSKLSVTKRWTDGYLDTDEEMAA